MTERTVKIGGMTYLHEGGQSLFALMGAVVDVADEDIARFDRLNGPLEDNTPAEPVKPRSNARKK